MASLLPRSTGSAANFAGRSQVKPSVDFRAVFPLAQRPSPTWLLHGQGQSLSSSGSPSGPLHQQGAPFAARCLHTTPRAQASSAASGEGGLDSGRPKGAAPLPGSREQVAALLPHLPQYCCGCGIKLQMEDAKGPGFFIIPAKLLEMGPAGLLKAKEAQAGGKRVLDDEDDDYLVEAGVLGREGAAEGPQGEVLQQEEERVPDVVCQRCYSLKHAGKVKVEAAEVELPAFDLGKKVGRKIFLQKDRRAVVLCVVDAWDFDGSLPRAALQSLYPPGSLPSSGEPTPSVPAPSRGPYAGPSAGAAPTPDGAALPEPKFRLMVALNKVDLLPKQATHARLTNWVRTRMRQAGLPAPEKVFCVSANKGVGVQALVEGVRDGLGFRGDLWVVGAQNAGKSSLISAMKRLAGTAGKAEPTIAPMPGTTLGLINVPGLPLGPKHRAFDTPGVPHAYQLTSLLSPAEVKQVLPSKAIILRTYRLSAGQCVLLGGLARIDVVEHPGATMYLTVCVSSYVNLHMGKQEGVEERVERHVGGQLTPPASLERWRELPRWTSREVVVEGDAWDKSSRDIHIAGLGWIAVGVKGRATLRVWVAPSVAVTKRPALIPDYAKDFQRPGFSSLLPKAPGPMAGPGASAGGAAGSGSGQKGGSKAAGARR